MIGFVKFVSSKTELETLSWKKPFLVRSEILVLIVKFVSSNDKNMFSGR